MIIINIAITVNIMIIINIIININVMIITKK